MTYFDRKCSRESKAAILWLLAGLSTGLRPSEWETAKLGTDRVLLVKNAKSTNGRSHGEYRSIDLSGLPAQAIKTIEIHLRNVQKANLSPGKAGQSGFELFYRNCRSCLYVATRYLWPRRQRHITLYSARHQFAADAKCSGLPLENIAALMGHASTETATHHYGRRSAGKGGFQAKADNQDVERVIALNRHRMDNDGVVLGM